MPNTFIEYLEQYISFSEIEEKELKNQSQSSSSNTPSTHPLSIRKNVVTKSKAEIKDAEEHFQSQGLGKIGRVFNDFPLQFTCESIADGNLQQHIFQAIEPAIFEKWTNGFFDLLINTKFEQDAKPITLKKNRDGELKDEETTIAVCRIFNPKSEKEFYALLDEIIIKASDELLDENGQLKERVIHLLGLQHLVKRFETLPAHLEEIKLQVIYCYISQIILGNMVGLLTKKASESNLTADSLLDFNLNACALTLLMKTTLQEHYVKKDLSGNEESHFRFAPYFKERIQSSLDIRFNQYAIIPRCAVGITKLYPYEVKKLIDTDFTQATLFQNQLATSNKQTEKSVTLTLHKMHFWIDVCDFYLQQMHKTTNQDYFLPIQTVLRSLSKWVDTSQLNDVYSLRYTACVSLAEDYPQSVMQNSDVLNSLFADSSIPIENNLPQLLNVDTNSFLIDDFIKTTKAKLKKLSATEQHFFNKILLYKTQMDFMQQSPRQVMEIIYQMASSSNITTFPISIAESYQNAFGRIDFLHKADADIAILHALFARIPTDIKDYKVPNLFEPDNLAESGLTLEKALENLEEYVNKLKSSSVLPEQHIYDMKKYGHILDVIMNGLITAVNDQFEENKEYILANDAMRAVYEKFLSTITDIKKALAKLNDPNFARNKWLDTFKKFSRSYADCANKLSEFLNIIQDLQKAFAKPITSDSPTITDPQSGNLNALKIKTKPVEENKLEEKTAEVKVDAHIFSLLSNESLFKMVIHAERPRTPTYDHEASRLLRVAEKRKELESIYPAAYPTLIATLTELDQHLECGNYKEALALIKTLPPKLRDLGSYSTVDNHKLLAINFCIVKDSKARFHQPTTAAINADEAKQLDPRLWEGEEKLPIGANAISSMQDYVLNIFDESSEKITPKRKAALRNMIENLRADVNNQAEFAAILTVESQECQNSQEKNLLKQCVTAAKKFFPADFKFQYDHALYENARQLVKYINKCEGVTFKFSSREREVEIARKLSRSMMQLSLIKANPSVDPDVLNKKQKELSRNMLAVVDEKFDPEFIKLIRLMITIKLFPLSGTPTLKAKAI